ncbi:MAG: secondary thiamine-phosphate synthase enzyme YjbQ [Alphaproteobacteria bacterium]|jgi:secondary thiamine-phosphate synthase enzyme
MKDRMPPVSQLKALDSKTLAQANHRLSIRTNGQGFVEITAAIQDWLKMIRAGQGLLTVFIAHTSASLTIQENADPAVLQDLADTLARLAPKSANYRHACEGPDDMPAHIKTMLTSVSLSIPVVDGRSALGTWQGVYVAEHRSQPHQRNVELHFIGACHTSP